VSVEHYRQQLAAFDEKQQQQQQNAAAAAINLEFHRVRICHVCCRIQERGHQEKCGDEKNPKCPGHRDGGKSCLLPTDELKARSHPDYKQQLQATKQRARIQQRLQNAEEKQRTKEEKKVRVCFVQQRELVLCRRKNRSTDLSSWRGLRKKWQRKGIAWRRLCCAYGCAVLI
jgi:hypothetical protein